MHVDHKLIVRPYVFISGSTLENITSAYVILGNHTYQVMSRIFAVDLCFQCCKVFNEKFSDVSSHLWQLLEKIVYDFDVPGLSKCVSDLLNTFKRM